MSKEPKEGKKHQCPYCDQTGIPQCEVFVHASQQGDCKIEYCQTDDPCLDCPNPSSEDPLTLLEAKIEKEISSIQGLGRWGGEMTALKTVQKWIGEIRDG